MFEDGIGMNNKMNIKNGTCLPQFNGTSAAGLAPSYRLQTGIMDQLMFEWYEQITRLCRYIYRGRGRFEPLVCELICTVTKKKGCKMPCRPLLFVRIRGQLP